jgi:hypothetical protein
VELVVTEMVQAMTLEKPQALAEPKLRLASHWALSPQGPTQRKRPKIPA